jgi:hypothetical protein
MKRNIRSIKNRAPEADYNTNEHVGGVARNFVRGVPVIEKIFEPTYSCLALYPAPCIFFSKGDARAPSWNIF